MQNDFIFLHEKALQYVATYLRAESDLIAVLLEIDDCRGYREIGFKSLFEYATQGLKLSESVSYNLISIARKSREVPKLQEMIRDKEISVSNARMITPVLTPQNQESLLSAAASMSKRELEKEIAKEFPESHIQERVRYVAETRLEFKLSISEKLHDKLKRIQDLVSSQAGEAASWERALDEMADVYLEKKDPMERAKRVEARAARNESAVINANEAGNGTQIQKPVPGQVSQSRYVPAQIAHAVRIRDNGQCSFKLANGGRCKERRWLEIHHWVPLSQGGLTSFDNLTLICRGHHQLIHRN